MNTLWLSVKKKGVTYVEQNQSRRLNMKRTKSSSPGRINPLVRRREDSLQKKRHMSLNQGSEQLNHRENLKSGKKTNPTLRDTTNQNHRTTTFTSKTCE